MNGKDHMRRILLMVAAVSWVGCPSEEIENEAPSVVITAPEDGFIALEGEAHTFEATVSDEATPEGSLSVSWTSSDLEFSTAPVENGVTTAAWAELPVGNHTVVLTVTDGDGAAGTDTIDVIVRPNGAPVVEFLAPDTTVPHYPGAVGFELSVLDSEGGEIGVVIADGTGATLAEPTLDDDGRWAGDLVLDAGPHSITATATDALGLEGSATLELTVRDTNIAPTCAIIDPTEGLVITDEATFAFSGTVGDDQTPIAELLVLLSSSIDGELATLTAEAGGAVTHTTNALTSGVHTITLTVTDDAGAFCEATATLIRSRPPSVGIYAPDADSVWNDTDSVHFEGIVYDADDEEETLVTEWSSSIDGLLGASIPLTNGDVELDVTDLTPGLHDITLTVTDSSGWQASAVLPIVVNGTPTAPGVAIDPASPLTTDPLDVLIPTPSTDVDSDPLMYDYVWSVGGTVQSAYNGLDQLPASATTKGETWEVAVTATDGVGTSPAGTASATVLNTPPTVASAYVDPPFGVSTTTYSAIGVGWVDDDGDAEGYTYQWFVNGAPVVGETSGTFDASSQPLGAVFHCDLTAWDGEAPGNTVTSATATTNTPPVATSVNTNPPGSADEYDSIVASATTTDVDGQTVTMQWQWHNQNGPIVGATTDTLTGADFDRDDVVFVMGTPNDGVELGTPVPSASVTIVNAPPSVGIVSITPAVAYPTDPLGCSYNGFNDPDVGDTDQSTFAWTADGVPIGTGPTISSGYSSGALVTCFVTPYDGITQGAPVSAQITIQNNVPVLNSLSIDTPVTKNAPATTSFTATDIDGDTVSLVSNWSRNGTLVAVAESLSASLYAKGDSLTVVSAPTDGVDVGSTMSAGPVIVQNSPPVSPTILVAPPVPEAGVDDLDCQVLTPASDPDVGDILTYTFTWTVDGAPWTGPVTTNGSFPGNRIDASQTSDDQVWECTVVVSDNDPTPLSSPPATSSIEVTSCNAIDFLGAPAGLVLDWTGTLSGSPYADMTLELWVKGGGLNGGYMVTSYDSTGSSASWLYSGLGWSSQFTGNTWKHIARVWDSSAGQLRSYVNGILRDTDTYYGPYFGDLGLYIGGASHAVSGNYWNGELAGLRLSDNVRYSGASFITPTTYGPDGNTILFVPMNNSISGEAFDEGPFAFPVTNNANATLGGNGLYCY